MRRNCNKRNIKDCFFLITLSHYLCSSAGTPYCFFKENSTVRVYVLTHLTPLVWLIAETGHKLSILWHFEWPHLFWTAHICFCVHTTHVHTYTNTPLCPAAGLPGASVQFQPHIEIWLVVRSLRLKRNKALRREMACKHSSNIPLHGKCSLQTRLVKE